MNAPSSILGAFSEDQVAALTGLSKSQLRAWGRRGFIRPEFKAEDGRRPFSRIYSFKDLLKLRVLNQLRNVHNVTMRELEKVGRELSHLGDDKWTSQKLWVFRRRVVFEEPETHRRREIASKQYVFEIPLEVITADARTDIQRLNRRDEGQVGEIERRRHLHSSDEVFAGTRIPIAAVLDYVRAGSSDDAIIDQFPSLQAGDIEAARARLAKAA